MWLRFMMMIFCRESSTLEEQKQPLTKNIVPAPTATVSCSQAAVADILPPTASATGCTVSGSNLAAQAQYTNQCTMVQANCAGCVQFQQQCQQQQQNHEAMEMTAILHSQPPLQLVSCHGPIMHPSTPSNQRWVYWFCTAPREIYEIWIFAPIVKKWKKFIGELITWKIFLPKFRNFSLKVPATIWRKKMITIFRV